MALVGGSGAVALDGSAAQGQAHQEEDAVLVGDHGETYRYVEAGLQTRRMEPQPPLVVCAPRRVGPPGHNSPDLALIHFRYFG